MGKLIVLEGIDGSGKSTQYARLRQRLDAAGTDYRSVVFPRYDMDSSALIRMYLGGQFGQRPGDVNAYMASTFYAVDRIASFATDWGAYYKAGGLVLADRYTTSNAVHQGSKLPESGLPAFLDWLCDFEYGKLELPRPDLVIYLATELEQSLSSMRSRQSSTHTSGDIHEKDAEYLARCLLTGEYAASHYGWRRVRCVRDGELRSVEDIHSEIWDAVSGVIYG